MPLVLVVLVVLGIVSLAALVTVVGEVLGAIAVLFVAGLVGATATAVMPQEMPFGLVGATLVGLVGTVLGVFLAGSFGPSLFGVPVLPAVLGAVIVTSAYGLIGRRLETGSTL